MFARLGALLFTTERPLTHSPGHAKLRCALHHDWLSDLSYYHFFSPRIIFYLRRAVLDLTVVHLLDVDHFAGFPPHVLMHRRRLYRVDFIISVDFRIYYSLKYRFPDGYTLVSPRSRCPAAHNY